MLEINLGSFKKACSYLIPLTFLSKLFKNLRDLSGASEKAVAIHSSTLAWKLPWMEEPGRLLSVGSWRVRHDWVTLLSLFIFMHWRRKWQPTAVFLSGESQGRRAWWAAVYGVAQSRTRLKWFSSSSSSSSSSSIITSRLFTFSKPLFLYYKTGMIMRVPNL